MISQRAELPIVAFSVKVYRALLLAYPTRFQQEYGSDMAQVFQDCCLRTLRQGGMNGMVRLWAVTLLDLVQSVISEHTQKETDMKKDDFVRLGGWSLMVGAIAFLPGAIGMLWNEYSQYTINWNSPPMQVLTFAVFWAPILLAVGMMGLQARYKIGNSILLLGAVIGSIIIIVGNFGQIFAPVYSVSATYYYVWIWGVFLLNACLSVFGILALIQKPLARWNALPLIAGAWIPLLPLLSGMIKSSVESFLIIVIAGLVVMTIAQVMLGYILKSDVPEQTAAPT